MTDTNGILVTVSVSCIHSGGPEHGQFKIHVLNFLWWVRKIPLELLLEDLTDSGFCQTFPVHPKYQQTFLLLQNVGL